MKYLELREKVGRGARFSIDFKKRTLKMNGKPIDVKDVYCELPEEDDVLSYLHDTYELYKHSVPSEKSEKRQRNYFKALPYDKLTDDDMLYNLRREETRFMLEFAILKLIVDGKLKWNEEWGSWFWQDPNDKDFVILREWVEPQQEK